MHAKGQPYQEVAPADNSRVAAASPYLLLDQQRAKADGYGIVEEAVSGSAAEPPDVNKKLTDPMSATARQRWSDALTGTSAHRRTITPPDGLAFFFSTDGCVYAARRELYGDDWERLSAYAQAWSNMVIDQVTRTPAMRDAVVAWSACMTKAGHPFSALDAPRKDIVTRWSAAGTEDERRRVARSELSVARADSSCQATAKLADAAAAAQQEVEHKLTTPAVTADLAKARAAWAAAKTRATAIVKNAAG
jgi:hypothetical protein